ncbi:MAG: YfhO family protein [Candidatus Daviesbacteria bacterium]|nr:YfhO family protein [Candidatus Daviesbacteria bacterium]
MQIYLYKGLILTLLLFILIIPLFSSLLRPGFFPMQDDLQAFRIHQMVKCLNDFQIPCRWVPDMGYQYGYPQFNFYPPSVFYLGGILNLLGIQIIDSVKLLFILGFILSALTMFIFLKTLMGEWPAFIGSILYSFTPYKAQEVYVRGSLSEFFAFIFFPLIFWSAYKLIKSGKLRYIGWLAFSTGFLLITHNLMSFIFLPIFGVWVVTLSVIYKKWGVFPKVIVGSLLGLGLASFFTLPVICTMLAAV